MSKLVVLKIAMIKALAQDRPLGYEADVMSFAKKSDSSRIWLEKSDLDALYRKYNPSNPIPIKVQPQLLKPVPRDQWPPEFKALSAFANENDKGLGDTFARLAAATGVASAVHWVVQKLGKDCGCKARQGRWNQLYPLDHGSAVSQ